MHKATLIFPIQHGKVLLSYVHKQGKVTSNKWNGYGGKLETENEDLLYRALKEFSEEVYLRAHPDDLKLVAINSFYFGENATEPAFKVAVYFLTEWQGVPGNSDEMSNPTPFGFDKIPYEQMMPADREWLPLILAGETFEGTVIFSEDGKEVLSFSKINKDPSSLSF